MKLKQKAQQVVRFPWNKRTGLYVAILSKFARTKGFGRLLPCRLSAALVSSGMDD
jgi:hypothetical protein